MDTYIINSIFEDTASRFPENIAISEGSRSITYRGLNANANRAAHALAEVGVTCQSIVGLYFDASIEYVTALLGALKAGTVFMPLNTRFPEKRLADVLNKTKPSIFITSTFFENEFFEKLPKLNLDVNPSHILVLDNAGNLSIKSYPGGIAVTGKPDFTDENPPLNAGPDDGCYIVTTSGSTGEPKVILGSHKGLSHFINWEISEFGLNQNLRVSLFSPVTFDVSLRDIFVPLTAGGTLCIPDEETRHNPRELLNWMRQSRITLTHIIPTVFRLLIREVAELGRSDDALPDLECVMIAGEPLFGNDVINWRQANGNRIELVNLYGPSETTLAKLFYRIKDGDFTLNEIVPLGKPIPDTEVLIIKNDKLCGVAETGEIYIKTPFMTKGYYNAPELNEMSFVQNPLIIEHREIVYKTGDQGKFSPDGNVQFEGRLDGQVKLYGQRVEIGEIEVALRQHPSVRQAAVTARQDAFGNLRLVGYVVPEPGQKPPVESLRSFVGERLPDYMVPAVFVTMESFPLTHNDKIDRGALPEPDGTRPEMEEVYVSPSTTSEKSLSDIWCRVLGLDRVGTNDNFFDLGGSSILAVRIIASIQEELGIEIPVVKLFQYPNISLMAKYLSQNQSDEPSYEDIQKRAQRRRDSFNRRKRTTIGS